MKELSCCDYFCEFNEHTEMFDSEVKKKGALRNDPYIGDRLANRTYYSIRVT